MVCPCHRFVLFPMARTNHTLPRNIRTQLKSAVIIFVNNLASYTQLIAASIIIIITTGTVLLATMKCVFVCKYGLASLAVVVNHLLTVSSLCTMKLSHVYLQ